MEKARPPGSPSFRLRASLVIPEIPIISTRGAAFQTLLCMLCREKGGEINRWMDMSLGGVEGVEGVMDGWTMDGWREGWTEEWIDGA